MEKVFDLEDSMSERKRIYYFDLAKGIGILLVVMGHLEYISMELRYFIASFHMPMFFVISGMLMYLSGEENKEPAAFVKGKLYRIGMPYLSYSILYLLIETALFYLKGEGSFANLFQDAYLSLCLYGISVLWFLPAMFFGLLIFFFLRKNFSHKLTILAVCVLTAISYFLTLGLDHLNLLYGMNFWFYLVDHFLAMILRSFFAAFYLAAGYYLFFAFRKYRDTKVIRTVNAVKPVLAVLILASIAYLSQVNGAVDLHFLIFANPFLYLYDSLGGSVAVILLCRWLEKYAQTVPGKVVCYYGKNSLTVMATHINSYVLYVAIIISLFLSKYITRAKNYIFCTMILVIVFAAEFFVIELINRYLPFFAGSRRSKNKK